VVEDRFNRHYRRIQLGLRLLSHGARTQTASDWSGLTPDRLVTLKRRWMPERRDAFRGPAPKSFQLFFRSVLRTRYAALFASIHSALSDESSGQPSANDLRLGLDNGERLCEAFEICQEWQPGNDLEFDQAVLLARGVAANEDLELARCSTCHCALLIDKLALAQGTCARCRRKAADRGRGYDGERLLR
jgi:hypothetical protein